MNEKKYEEKFKEYLLEEYKLYVEMADRTSQRREQTNNFYVSLISGLLALLSLLISRSNFSTLHYLLILNISILGILICVLWHVNIISYKNLNTGKFKVIHEMEEQLPYPCYKREWDILEKGKSPKKYLPITHIQQYIPLIMIIPYACLLIYSLYNLILN